MEPGRLLQRFIFLGVQLRRESNTHHTVLSPVLGVRAAEPGAARTHSQRCCGRPWGRPRSEEQLHGQAPLTPAWRSPIGSTANRETGK